MRQLPENFFGWNDHKSIMLTKFATLAAAMGCVVMVLCGPRIVSWVLAVHALQLVHGPKLGYFLLGLGYCSDALALWMLYNLYMFLARIEKKKRKRCLPLPTCWPCGASAGVAPRLPRYCLPVGAVLGLPFIFAIGVAAAFMALIVRVIKNAFAQAVKMKDELDYTV